MTILDGQRVIAIEEHYSDPEVTALFEGIDGNAARMMHEQLDDVGEARLKSMDAAGIDVQVLSHAPPGPQRLDPETAVRVSKAANDRLRDICSAHPDRFAGFAMLPTPDPAAAADELERCVDKLGFKGALIHGLTGAERLFIDDERFWPIFERAEALDVPLYIHPAIPHPDVVDAYFKPYAKDHPGFLTAGWGFTMETATAGIRIILSGVLEKYPGTKIIMGHLGETLPFLLWRIDLALNRRGAAGVPFRELFTKHFHVTTSGFFSDPALLCCIQEMGTDRILFAVDYPFVPQEPGPKWMEGLMLNDTDKAKILHGNAETLLKL
ncbi:MAG: amidohydrolase family protein [Rhodospirillaceae bacterium]|nr:amidohydrolase family protein [Rhodospirillaceae bacterium]MDD9913400.1 amidohydrolase family protein [Rhodospirillaceae bacterium]MDD9928004.1 amidohydrolase family protein [Rhodospirillaceae bacterium]